MNITKINANTQTNGAEPAANVDFKAIKLNRSSLKMAKPLERDVVELKSKLPDNKLAKDNKYFGNAEIGGCGGNNNSNDNELVPMLVAWGAALAACALM